LVFVIIEDLNLCLNSDLFGFLTSKSRGDQMWDSWETSAVYMGSILVPCVQAMEI